MNLEKLFKAYEFAKKNKPDKLIEVYEIAEKYGGEKLFEVYEFTKEAHKGVKRKSGEDYITHPISVADIVEKYNADNTTIYACLLHDVVEDTKYEFIDIREKFGWSVTYLVDGVTKLGKEEKGERYLDTVEKVKEYSKINKRVIFIKMADNLNNIINAIHPETGKVLINMEKYNESVIEYIKLGGEHGYYGLAKSLKENFKVLNNFLRNQK